MQMYSSEGKTHIFYFQVTETLISCTWIYIQHTEVFSSKYFYFNEIEEKSPSTIIITMPRFEVWVPWLHCNALQSKKSSILHSLCFIFASFTQTPQTGLAEPSQLVIFTEDSSESHLHHANQHLGIFLLTLASSSSSMLLSFFSSTGIGNSTSRIGFDWSRFLVVESRQTLCRAPQGSCCIPERSHKEAI